MPRCRSNGPSSNNLASPRQRNDTPDAHQVLAVKVRCRENFLSSRQGRRLRRRRPFASWPSAPAVRSAVEPGPVVVGIHLTGRFYADDPADSYRSSINRRLRESDPGSKFICDAERVGGQRLVSDLLVVLKLVDNNRYLLPEERANVSFAVQTSGDGHT